MKNSTFVIFSFAVIFLIIFSASIYSQTYSIGHKQITFTDPSRSNRSIQTEIYYPATSAGDNTPFETGQFPVIVFGHGFVMVWSAYQWMWDSIVPHGFIMAFPRTEGSISPSHSEFGLDLAFLNNFIKTENSNSSSFFYQHVSSNSAIMGHSMGGGSSFLAAQNNTNLSAVINFAAATTTPSSITAASNVTVPTLMFLGENDGVAPPLTHQIPMYDSCSSQCKTRITILGGGHCYFGNSNFNCSFGEGTTSPQPTISRDEQHIITSYLLMPYLDFILKNNLLSESIFLDRLTTANNITYVQNCTTSGTSIQNIVNERFKFKPNPFENIVEFESDKSELPIQLTIYDITGRKIISEEINNIEESITMSEIESGSYIITLIGKINNSTQILIKK